MEASVIENDAAARKAIADHIRAFFEGPGSQQWYDGYEAVSQTRHALQCAQNAIAAGAEERLVSAAFLHDIGHLIDLNGRDKFQSGTDAQHEEIGANWLGQWFPPSVTEPIRWHVAAKRYLCATELSYHASLSLVSQRSLELQGGAMSAGECAAFEKIRFSADAIRLRRWDDYAKDPEKPLPDFQDVMAYTIRCIQVPLCSDYRILFSD